jgi:hypothetical protein
MATLRAIQDERMRCRTGLPMMDIGGAAPRPAEGGLVSGLRSSWIVIRGTFQ